jgi:hypothetical protein
MSDNPFGEKDLGARLTLITLQVFVFALALMILALVSYE